MDWYYYIALAAIVSQLLFLISTRNNFHFVLAKYKTIRPWYRPRTVLLVPCKGIDSAFQKNIVSFFNQDYDNYLLWFVVADKSDPAYSQLCNLKNQLQQSSKALDVQIHIAGQAKGCGQKIHNLLYCYHKIGHDVEIMAFVDSDICIRSNWLSHIVYPLRNPKNGVATGYRWFVPKKNNLATLALSAVNAKIAQLLGNTRFNHAWGGSMAIRVDLFRQLGLDKIWPNTVSDDLTLSRAVKKTGKKVAFVPACLVASHESTTWSAFFEFGRRQFLITRINAPWIWWFGLLSSLYSVLGLWATAGVAVYAAMIGEKNFPLYVAVPILFFTTQLLRAILRQVMIAKLLKEDSPKMKTACAADIFFFWIWSLLLLFLIISSAFGRTIRWRRIRYKLLGPTKTIVIAD